MIVHYAFKNYKSFKDESVLYMTPVNALDELKQNIFEVESDYTLIKNSNNQLLKIVGISGQNASGKSSLIESLTFMKKMIKHSFNKIDANQEEQNKDEQPILSLENFMYLNEESSSSFELSFIKNNVNYTYGFELNKKEIISEWLKNNDKGVEKLFFERKGDQIKLGNQKNIDNSFIKLASKILKERKEVLALSLFKTLGETGKNNEIQDIYDYFINDLTIYENYNALPALANFFQKDKNSPIFDSIKCFIRAIDVRIVDILVSEDLNQDYPFISVHEIQLEDGTTKTIKLPFSKESAGTKKILATAFHVITTLLIPGRVMIVDEFDDKVHTNLFIEIIKLFQESESQFIFATHNPYILEHNFLRRDQIYFVDKNKFEESSLYSLSDFKGVRTTDSYQKRYLNGNYGAIPIVDFSNLKKKIFFDGFNKSDANE